MRSITNGEFHLFIVATPIGNLQEISERAKNVLQTKHYFLCEDTRTTIHLFQLLNISYSDKEFISYHKYNEKQKLQEIENVLGSNDIVLVSDAGYPGFSDPGYVIIEYCIEKNIYIEVINGPNAFINAFIVSGFSNLPVTFYGFLDWKKHNDSNFFPKTVLCFYEAVHRINDTLSKIYKIFGNLPVCVVRELTKLNETHYYGTLKSFSIPTSELKGEFVILVDNSKSNNEIPLENVISNFKNFNKQYDNSNIKNRIRLFLEQNKITHVKANAVYEKLLKGEEND